MEFESEISTTNALRCKYTNLDIMGINIKGNVLYVRRFNPAEMQSNMNQNFHFITPEEYMIRKESIASKVICIKNLVYVHELEDDRDLEDLYDLVYDECKEYARVNKIKIPKLGPGSSSGKVFVEFSSREGAKYAKEQLDGKRLNHRLVSVVFHSEEDFSKGNYE